MSNYRKIVLSLGSNIEPMQGNIEMAIQLLEKQLDSVIQKSSFYQSEAWGDGELDDFVNVVIAFDTDFSSEKLQSVCQNIEMELGRKRTSAITNRTIDIDILFIDDEIIDTSTLQVPHPRIHLRNFVLIPCMEIMGDFVHPTLNKNIEELYLECKDDKDVILMEK
ncbi:MAG: 2-amino-4-hydroxy-6-hydroxymethyldihydropteridine diphosphokinase [Saprospiraceae bacterium]|nr:2-amino-4-hydroxy-6-hydroxymethyldihydropteridine diphosphokinase [Saprospiraceae bacterium]